MKIKLKHIVLLFILLFATISFAQNLQTNQITTEQAKDFFEKSKLYNNQDPDSAAVFRQNINELLRYYEKEGISSNHAYYNFLLGNSMFGEKQLDSALYYLKKAIEKKYEDFQDTSRWEIQKNSYHLMIQSYRALGELDSALIYLEKIINLAETENDHATVARYFYFKGVVYDRLEQHTESFENFKLAAELYIPLEDDAMIAKSLFSAGNQLYNYLWRDKEAMQMGKYALPYAIRSGDKRAEANCIGLIATVYDAQGEHLLAIEYFRKELAIYAELKDELSYQLTELQMMSSFNNAKQKDSARIYMRKTEAEEIPVLFMDTVDYPWGARKTEMKLANADVIAQTKTTKFDILNKEFEERKAATFRLLIWLISVLALSIIITLLLLYNRQRQKAKAEAAARYAQEKENEYIKLLQETEIRMIRKYIDGLESERSRISKELHDGVCNDLLALEMRLKNNEKDIETQTAFLRKTRENIRNVSHELMPPVFQYATIDEILSDYISHISAPENTTVTYTQTKDVDWNVVPQKTAFEIYRITQETLGNSIKHAKATKIENSLTFKENELILEIRDNGIGFDSVGRSRGAGLKIIRERVESIGGILHINANENGTIVLAKFNLL